MAKASSQALRVRRLQYEIRAIREFRTAGDERAWERG